MLRMHCVGNRTDMGGFSETTVNAMLRIKFFLLPQFTLPITAKLRWLRYAGATLNLISMLARAL